MSKLAEFEGHEVIEVGVEMPNAAGGLQEAMKFDPVEWHISEEGYIVLHYVTKKVRHEPIDKDNYDGPLRRVHVLHVDEAAPIEGAVIGDVLVEQRERIQKAKDEAVGQPSLLEGDDDEELPVGEDDD